MIRRYASITILVLVFACAYVYTQTVDADQKDFLAGLFGVLLGSGLLLQAVHDWQDGKIKGARVYINRTERTGAFYAAWLIKRTLPGAAMLVAGIWYWIVN